MKKYILLTLTLIALAFNAQAGDGPWYFSQINVQSTPTGAGFVYVNGDKNKSDNLANITSETHDAYVKTHEIYMPYTWYVNTKAQSDTYKFVGWKLKDSDEILSTEKSYSIEDKGEKMPVTTGTNTGGSNDKVYIPDNYYTLELIAVYEPISQKYITVESNNENFGASSISNDGNQSMNEVVTISAYTTTYTSKFLYWEKDGKIFSKEKKVNICISEETKGKYKAVFDSGYQFFHIYNKRSSRHIEGISDNGSVTDFSSLSLTSPQKAMSSPGCIWEITDKKIPSRTNPSFIYKTQNFSSEEYYNYTSGIGAWISSIHDTDNDTWTIYSQSGAPFMADLYDYENNVTPEGLLQNDGGIDDGLQWYYEPMDKDLTTKENYFTFDPEKLLFDENTGKYYTTLRTAWNVLFDTNEIKAYIVTGVNEDGVLTKTEVTGGIIPKNTCVLIECNSNDTDRNVMVPTNTAASFTATGNKLVSNEKYFPNQNAPESNYKALTLINGALGFGGEACSKINGNDAYMQRDDDVFVSSPKLLDLTTVISENNTTKKYNMKDLICVKAVPNLDDGSAILYCKDDNGYEDKYKDKNENGYNDYILNVFSGDGYRDSHDQSNWIALYAPAELFPTNAQSAPGLKDEQPVANSAMLGLQEQKINNVVGVMTDLKNPALTLKSLPVANAENKYTLNTYVPANFKGTQNGYFFISPKPMEIAQIRWAVWTGDHFVNIPKTAISNTADLEGSFDVDFSLMESDIRPVENGIYDFVGLIKIKDEAQLQAADEMDAARRYVVYPFNLNHTFDIVEGFPTGIKDVDIKDVKSVKYYNLMGHGSDAPHKGVNIIVTTMKDGTTKTSKRVF